MSSNTIVSGALLAQVLLVAILFGGTLIVRSAQSRTSWWKGHPSYAAFGWELLLLLLVSVACLVFTDAMSAVWLPLFNDTKFSGLASDTALLLVFVSNILVVARLIYLTGGSLASPFQPTLFLVPTLALFLHESSLRVSAYSVLVTIVFWTMMHISDPPQVENRPRLKAAYGFISSSCLGLAVLIGLLTRR